jgi:hypothetical protein
MDTADPVFQTVVAPFGLALLVVAAARLGGGAQRSDIVAGAGVALAILVGYALFEGIPRFPPPAAKQKLFYLIALGAALGLIVDSLGRPAFIDRLVLLVFPAVCVIWLAWRQLSAGPALSEATTLLLLWVGMAAALWRTAEAGNRGGSTAGPVLVIVAALGIAGVAMLGRTMTLSLLSLTIAAATGALAVWSHLSAILGYAARGGARTLLLPAAGGLAIICALLVLFTPTASRMALIGILLVPFTKPVARRIHLGSGAAERVLTPLVHGFVAALPALAAVGIAYVTSGGPGGF